MPRIIVKCRYIKNEAAHRSNLVSYMGTREGVEKNVDAEHPATNRQEEMIARLLRSAPDAKDMFEYEDYVTNPTAKSASEFITQALEQNADRFTDRKIFLEYIANRPRVQKLGTHGLFGDTDAPINLAEVQREVAEHPGNVWTNVVSLRREDAARLGFDNAVAWRTLMREKRNDIAKHMRIKPENFKWYGAFHDEGSHPHIHFIAYSKNPNEAYLTQKGIDGIRSCLAREIFQQDLLQIYSEQTIRRDTLNRESLSVMRDMCEQMQNGVCDNPQIETLMQTLADRLSKTGGKKQYGYLKADVKVIVDSIIDELAKDERVATCYDAWYEMRNQVLQTYADKLPDALPLSQQKEFKAIKNIVIAEAMKISSFDSLVISHDEPVFIDADVSDTEPVFFDEQEDDSAYRVDWSDEYKLARDFLFGTKSIAPDFGDAHALLLMEAQSGNALAIEKDVPTAIRWLTESAEQGNQFAQYQLGKLYLLDRDVPRDREQAVHWFTLSAAQGNEYAQFFLDHMDEFHDPSLLFSASRLLSSLSKLFDDQQQKQTAQADHIDRKRMRELRQKMQAQGHARDEQVQNYW